MHWHLSNHLLAQLYLKTGNFQSYKMCQLAEKRLETPLHCSQENINVNLDLHSNRVSQGSTRVHHPVLSLDRLQIHQSLLH